MGVWEERDSHGRETECLAEGIRVQMHGERGIVHAWPCPYLRVRVSLSESLSSRCRLFPD